MKNIFNEQIRGYIYRILVAVGILLVGFGILTGEQLTLILGVVIAVLNVMPSANTSIAKPIDVSEITNEPSE